MVSEHRFNGWPGAICMKCGAEDPREIALADNEVWFDVAEVDGDEQTVVVYKDPKKIERLMECPVPTPSGEPF